MEEEMDSGELKEWVGIKPADLLVYASCGAIVAMYFTKSILLDSALSVVAIVLCIISCFVGMRADENLSGFTNVVKKVVYPVCLVAILVFIYLNFTRWNGY
jgi:hypothetical protein